MKYLDGMPHCCAFISECCRVLTRDGWYICRYCYCCILRLSTWPVRLLRTIHLIWPWLCSRCHWWHYRVVLHVCWYSWYLSVFIDDGSCFRRYSIVPILPVVEGWYSLWAWYLCSLLLFDTDCSSDVVLRCSTIIVIPVSTTFCAIVDAFIPDSFCCVIRYSHSWCRCPMHSDAVVRWPVHSVITVLLHYNCSDDADAVYSRYGGKFCYWWSDAGIRCGHGETLQKYLKSWPWLFDAWLKHWLRGLKWLWRLLNLLYW